jgi:hypothetical protein
MLKLTRISFVVVAAAGLFVCAANTLCLRQKISRIRSDLQNQTAGRTQAESALAEAKTEVKVLLAELGVTQANLEMVAAQRQEALAAANEFKLRLIESGLERLSIGRERDHASQELARYQAAGLDPEQIVRAALYIRELESRLTKLHSENQLLHTRLSGFTLVQAGVPALPPGLKGRVLNYDPKWRFLVLDVGKEQGVEPRGEMLVSRDGKLVAKVSIASVQADRCIANILPEWEFGEVVEGDQAQSVPPPI